MSLAAFPNITMIQHESELGNWTVAQAHPSADLRPYVRSYVGYIESASRPVRRREMPSSDIVMIINFGAPYRIEKPEHGGSVLELGSFVAGLHDSFTITEATGPAHCIQVNLTPPGARMILGTRMDDLAHRTLPLEDVIGPVVGDLIYALQSARTWPTRFGVLDRALRHRLQHSRPLQPEILWAWTMISRPDVRPSTSWLASEIGWSRKHFISRFRETVGLPPVATARILRFEEVVRSVDTRSGVCWSTIAADAGYFDQSHFIRDFRKFSGSTPTEFLSRRLTDGTGVLDDLDIPAGR